MFHYFKILYFTCTFFTKFIYNEYIESYFLSHVVLKILPVNSPRFKLENQPPGIMSCPFLDGYLEILSFGTYLPDELLNLRLIPTPTSSTPTSNGDLSHPKKISRYGHVPVFPHSQSHRESITYTQNYNDIDLDPSGAHKSGKIWATRTALQTTPSKYCGTSS
jgi:hypothetical protein